MSDVHKGMMSRINGPLLLAVWLCVAFACACACAFSASAFAAPDEKGVVRVGYYENEVFQEGAADGAVKTGYAYEYYRKLSEYTGWDYEYVYGNYADLYQMLLDGKVDLLAGLAWKEERADLIGYPDDPMGHETYSLVKHDSDTSIDADPASLAGKKIGVLESAMVDVLNKYLDKHGVKANVVTFVDYEGLFASFDEHGVDVMAVEGNGAYGRNHAEVVCAFGASDFFLCVNKKRPDLLEELNAAQDLLAVEEPHYLDGLSEKYYPDTVSSRTFSAAEREWLATHDQLRVGYLEHYLPYCDTGGDGQVTGVVKDMIAQMVELLGVESLDVTYHGYKSYDEMIAAMSAGTIDVAFPVGGGLYYSEENGIYQSAPVVSAATELVYRGEYDDRVVAHLAVNENNRMQYYFVKTNFPDAEITLYSSIDECLDAVLAGEVGGVTLNGLRAFDILKNRRYSGLSIKQLNRGDDRCFGVEIGNEGLLKFINRGISVVGSDYAQTQAYRYADGLYSYSFLDLVGNYIWIFALLALAIALMVITLLVRDSRRSKARVREKEQAQRELEEKNRELEEGREALADALMVAEHANRAKTAFLNNMSHDIRTPMNAIVGFTALATSHIDDREAVGDYLGKISVSSQHLLSLINDVLDMSRIESGKMTVEEADVHLPDVIHDLQTIVQANASAKQLDLFVDTQDVVNENIVTDKLRLNQVLLNILSNAIKFTPAGGSISFRVIEKPSDAPGMANFQFRIKDNGIGMSEEFRETIFDAFTRERTSTVSGIEGTGLGMAITKNIVDMMGGRISLTSEEGKGTEFVVDIPCKISANAAKLEPIPELSGLRALVVDDDTDSCLSVCSMLREIGMRPDWTNYGKEAVVRTKEALDQADEFRAYIIDWMMPDLNGIETVRRIRSIIGDAAPIIVLTAYDWADVEGEAHEAGVTAFCSKPLFMSELRDVLAEPFQLADVLSERPAVTDFSGRRVLLAEDNELNQMIAIAILEESGFVVDVAPDGVQAVALMDEKPAGYYDVVLMDIQMPNMDGYEAAKRIRALDDPAKAGIPILAVTANVFEEDRKIALEAGMDGHLAKPYDVPVMLAKLAEVLDADDTVPQR